MVYFLRFSLETGPQGRMTERIKGPVLYGSRNAKYWSLGCTRILKQPEIG